jgi:hypothetical protein
VEHCSTVFFMSRPYIALKYLCICTHKQGKLYNKMTKKDPKKRTSWYNVK